MEELSERIEDCPPLIQTLEQVKKEVFNKVTSYADRDFCHLAQTNAIAGHGQYVNPNGRSMIQSSDIVNTPITAAEGFLHLQSQPIKGLFTRPPESRLPEEMEMTFKTAFCSDEAIKKLGADDSGAFHASVKKNKNFLVPKDEDLDLDAGKCINECKRVLRQRRCLPANMHKINSADLSADIAYQHNYNLLFRAYRKDFNVFLLKHPNTFVMEEDVKARCYWVTLSNPASSSSDMSV